MIFDRTNKALHRVMPVLQKKIRYKLGHKNLENISFSVGEYKIDNYEMSFYVHYDDNKGYKIYFSTILTNNINDEPCLFGESVSELQIFGANAAICDHYTELIEKIPDGIGFFHLNDMGKVTHNFGFLLPSVSEKEMCVHLHEYLTGSILGASIGSYASRF